MSDLVIDKSALETFGRRAGLAHLSRRPDLGTLKALTRHIMHKITYTNIHMLAHPGSPPGRDEITEHMLSLRGGPCSITNPFMNCYLRDYMGFDSTLIAADMDGGMRHVVILIKIGKNNETWLVDYGNGHPYLSPIQLSQQIEYHNAALFYQVTPVANKPGHYQMWHRNTKRRRCIDYTFDFEPRAHDYFDQMFIKHYSDPDFGHLLNCLRFVRFPGGEMIAIRSADRNTALIRTKAGKRYEQRLTSEDELVAAVKQHFPLAAYPIKEGLDYLRRRGHDTGISH